MLSSPPSLLRLFPVWINLATSSQHLKNLRVNEILCKPLNPLNLEEVHTGMKRELSR
ncbi:hypothetical protein [Methanoregula sp.]|uniref:hypothetical protein n=1 Tax=Methanoregula sp. TaxID=2052170 RepID=UPI003BB03ABE